MVPNYCIDIECQAILILRQPTLFQHLFLEKYFLNLIFAAVTVLRYIIYYLGYNVTKKVRPQKKRKSPVF